MTEQQQREIHDILVRRAREVSQFLREYTEGPTHFGSVELALTREIDRLKELAYSMDVPQE